MKPRIGDILTYKGPRDGKGAKWRFLGGHRAVYLGGGVSTAIGTEGNIVDPNDPDLWSYEGPFTKWVKDVRKEKGIQDE